MPRENGSKYVGTMRFSHVDHVAIAVKDLDAAILTYTRLFGAGPQKIETIDTEKVRVAFFAVGSTHIELLAATAVDSPVARHIANRGEGLHHICYAVPDLVAALASLAADGFAPMGKAGRIGAGGRPIAFFRPKQMGGALVELVESRLQQHLGTP